MSPSPRSEAPGRARRGARLLLLMVALSPGLLGGCSVLDEIGKLGGDEVAEADDPCADGAQGEGCPQEPGSWWANAKSLSADEMQTDIVRCRVGSASQFTSRESCLARGGTPSR